MSEFAAESRGGSLDVTMSTSGIRNPCMDGINLNCYYLHILG
jgi:hypothetical protein